jgi:elongator complex protein 3
LAAHLAPKLSESDRAAIEEISSLIASGAVRGRPDLERLKRQVAVKHHLSRFISNSSILLSLPEGERPRWAELLRIHPRRSASGIIIVTVFSAPTFSCPHGTCVFCPGGPRIGTPQSYMPDGPSQRIARSLGYDSFLQAGRSLRKYREKGHETSKAEAIIEGGTFIALPLEYQVPFVKGLYDGLNGSRSASSLEEAQRANESASSRCVGLTIESKPDWCEPSHIDLMLSYGVTRLEIGVQSLHEEPLRRSNRGHTVQDSVDAFRVARDAGLKVCAHMMPGLPGSSPAEDLEDVRRLFEDESFRPDMSKLYPTLVVRETALARWAEAGLYRPYTLEETVELLAEMKRHVPSWHRIMRIMREIPESDIRGGPNAGNLRELVLRRVEELGFRCGCIRCREVALDSPVDLGDLEPSLQVQEYRASEGTEVFASFEYPASGKLAAFVRMRSPSPLAHRKEMESSCVVRELKVYGRVVSVGARDRDAWQHRGLGAALLGEMERVARERFGARRLLVTSAVGTRNYYRRFGYEPVGPYMGKPLAGGSLA